MNNKFTRNLSLSNREIKGKRAILFGEDGKSAQEELVNEIGMKVRNIEREILDLEDLSPDSTTSLSPVKGTFNGKEWARKMQERKVELRLLKVEYETAKDTLEEYFTEEEETKE